MNQDFIDWLNSADNANNNTPQGTGLLIAPLSLADSHEDSDSQTQTQDEAQNQKIINETQNQQLEFNFDSDTDSEHESETHEVHEESSPQPESEISNILQELRHLRKQVEELDTPQISYEEPPPETWADSDSDSEIDSELYEHYEQGIDFQEYNDRTPHGTNFTRRLQRILHERKERAAEEKLREESHKNSHPYIAKGILLCLSLIIAFMFAVGVLVYLQKRVPNFINTKHDQSESVLESESESEPESKSQPQEKYYIHITQSKADDTHQNNTNQESRAATPLTFEDYLHEGNEAFNLGIYNSALKNFFRALELDDNDSRPYIGLAGAYRAKGLYFDSKRILDEAMMIFRKNPTIETALKILEGDSKHGTCKCNRSK